MPGAEGRSFYARLGAAGLAARTRPEWDAQTVATLVAANEAAAARYVQAGRPGADLVAAALRWRTDAPADDEALPVLEHDLIPLYRAFVDDHRARLAALGRHDLAAAFGAWRSRLDARP